MNLLPDRALYTRCCDYPTIECITLYSRQIQVQCIECGHEVLVTFEELESSALQGELYVAETWNRSLALRDHVLNSLYKESELKPSSVEEKSPMVKEKPPIAKEKTGSILDGRRVKRT